MTGEWIRFSGKDGRETEILFRGFQRGDENAFQKCIESYYGDGYPYKTYFQDGYLISRVNDGRMTVIVGVNRKGKIVGTSAARTDTEFKGSVLLLLRVVSPEVQGMGIASAMEERLFQKIYAEMSVCSFYADVITQSNFSQRTLGGRGYTACGFRFCLYRSAVMIPGGEWRPGQRLTQVIMCRKAQDQTIKPFYCPKEVRQSVSRIYECLGAEVQFLDNSKPLRENKTRLTEICEAGHSSRLWYVHQVGADYRILLEKTEPVDVFIVYINLCSPGAEELYLELKSEHFFYSGMKPLGDGEEYLIMTSLGGIELRREDIRLTSRGEVLLDEIIACRKDEKEDE